MPEVNGITVPFLPIVQDRKSTENNVKSSTDSFDIIFKKELSKLKFSGHAMKRLEARNIKLSENELSKIETAIEKAEAKGAKDSLVMMDDKAFIINVPNKTVITAMSISEDSDNIFTNIDSVVLT
jgi:flagellar operon protein